MRTHIANIGNMPNTTFRYSLAVLGGDYIQFLLFGRLMQVL